MPTKLSKGTYDVEVVVEQLLVISADVKRNAESLGRIDTTDKSVSKPDKLSIDH